MKTLYLTDLDGTLLRSDGRISDYTKSTVNRFIREGGIFSYATARSLGGATRVTAGIDWQLSVIVTGGAVIAEPTTQKILLTQYFTREEVEVIRQVFLSHNISMTVYAHINGVERCSFLENDVGIRAFWADRPGDPRRREIQHESELYDGDVFYIVCIGNHKQLSPIRDIFALDARVNCIYGEDLYTDAIWCELTPAKATKGVAALKLKTMLDCDSLVVFGDERYDLSMFTVADESYAMSNAISELKEIATAVIDSNDNDGVAKWLEKVH